LAASKWHAYLVLAVLSSACKRDDSKPASASQPTSSTPADPAPALDRIPRTTGPIEIDGEWNEPDWPQRALRFQFKGSDGELARPSSEVRFLHDATTVYVGLYAADQNIVSETDAFDLQIGAIALRLDPKGRTVPTRPDIKVGIDSDGTVDDPRDDDEEWKLEVAIPLTDTGLTRDTHVPVAAGRCDVPRDGIRRCGSWTGALTLD
jgi:hypothetical protein